MVIWLLSLIKNRTVQDLLVLDYIVNGSDKLKNLLLMENIVKKDKYLKKELYDIFYDNYVNYFEKDKEYSEESKKCIYYLLKLGFEPPVNHEFYIDYLKMIDNKNTFIYNNL